MRWSAGWTPNPASRTEDLGNDRNSQGGIASGRSRDYCIESWAERRESPISPNGTDHKRVSIAARCTRCSA